MAFKHKVRGSMDQREVKRSNIAYSGSEFKSYLMSRMMCMIRNAWAFNHKLRGLMDQRELKRSKKLLYFDFGLPYDILFHILQRFPAKSLMQFKCVCKSWRVLIEDPLFAKEHQAESEGRPDGSYILLFGYGYEGVAKAIVPLDLSGKFSSSIPLHNFFDSSVVCTEIVNGIVCLWDDWGIRTKLRALNVTTGEQVALPARRLSDRFDKRAYFLGYDPTTKCYKLLHFQYGDWDTTYKCEILTLGEKSWRQIECLRFEPRRSTRPMYSDGYIYWVNHASKNGHRDREVVCFAVNKERFVALDLPDGATAILRMNQIKDGLCSRAQYPRLSAADSRTHTFRCNVAETCHVENMLTLKSWRK